jgi:hypothetical protein
MKQALTALLTNLADILKVKTIITVGIVFTFCYLTLTGIIDKKDFLIIAATVITYYFTKKEDTPRKDKDDENEYNK